ncbi:hypothetical protein [Nonomuraea helvata]|uniref:Class I SAM-dependent methyltransferase n=1 Tax=Nonomuraea helvata TaxID=37484 RepID=A0ABV5SBH0_9ACTN
MPFAIPALTPLQASLWLTLCGRALDNRLSHPILGDTMADEVVRKVGYDYKRLRIPSSSAIYIAHRARKLDEIARRFIARHPDAVGLDLGAGPLTSAMPCPRSEVRAHFLGGGQPP